VGDLSPLLRTPLPRSDTASREARDAAGFSWATSHVFRKTCATILDEAGLSVRAIADQLGYITDPHAPHAERESRTVQFPPTVVPSYDAFLDRAVKIVGVSDDHDLVARCEADVQAQFAGHVSASRSQPHYLDVTHPTANKGVVVERLSHYGKGRDEDASCTRSRDVASRGERRHRPSVPIIDTDRHAEGSKR
jgi:haloacid dehalogenase-like hydrolase